jgi:hypothetical protein
MIRISGSAVPRKDGGARLGALEGANPQQEVREVADDDEGQGLNERELEDAHQDAAANEVLDLHAGSGPHAEEVARPGPTLAFGNVVDAVLLDAECLISQRVVDGC